MYYRNAQSLVRRIFDELYRKQSESQLGCKMMQACRMFFIACREATRMRSSVLRFALCLRKHTAFLIEVEADISRFHMHSCRRIASFRIVQWLHSCKRSRYHPSHRLCQHPYRHLYLFPCLFLEIHHLGSGWQSC